MKIKNVFIVLTGILLSQGALCEEQSPLKMTSPSCQVAPEALIEGQDIELRASITDQEDLKDRKFTYEMSANGLQVDPRDVSRARVIIKKETRDRAIRFRIPLLRDELQETPISFYVTVHSNLGATTFGLQSVVSRRLVFRRSLDSSKSCVEIKPAEFIPSVWVNNNDTDLTITTTDGTQKSVEQRDTKTKGWSILPTILKSTIGLSLFSFSSTHMKALAHQVSESSFVAVANVVNSGDTGFLYRQTTRFKQPFDMFALNECGKPEAQGVAYVEVESTVKNFHKYDSNETLQQVLKLGTFGVKPENGCEIIDQNYVKVPGSDQ